jgi:sodium-dependent dicarboxylate transporter 2/3/5
VDDPSVVSSPAPPQPEPIWLRLPWDRLGLVLGPAAMIAWLVFGISDDVPADMVQAYRLAGVLLLTIIWWITEPIPIPATGLLGVALAVAIGAVPVPLGGSGVAQPARVALAQFGNPTLFFLLGGMFLGRAMTRHGLDRRIALALLGAPGAASSPTTLLVAVGAAVMCLSMWISNTASTAMIYPVTLGIIAVLAASMGPEGENFPRSRYASVLLLMTAYASSAGGIATPIGTTTNVVAMGYFRQEEFFGRPVDFARWAVVGVPMALAIGLVLAVWLRMLAPAGKLDLASVRSYLAEERAKLGAWTAGERNTLAVFLGVVALWIAPSVLLVAQRRDAAAWLQQHFPEEIVALFAPVALFLLPVDWRRRKFSLEASDFARIDWGTLVLFGSGMALGDLMVRTGLVGAMASGTMAWLGTADLWLVTALAIAGGIVLSEFTSNAAAATALIPVVLGICREAEIDPVAPLLGVTFAASFGSALPISTPPNAIVYGSGLIPSRRMMIAGAGFDVACGVVVWLVLRAAYALGWTPFVPL